MIEPIFLYFGFSFFLLLVSLYLRKLDSFNQTHPKLKRNPNKLAQKYLQFLIKQLNFTIEKEKIEKDNKSIQVLLPSVNNYNNTIIPSHTIYYATQSNTSKRFAETLVNDSQTLKIKTVLKNISEISRKDFENNVLMTILISTYGEGGPSDDAIEFDKFLDKNKNGIGKEDGNPLKDLTYTIFGLGSRKYEHFNAMAKKVDNVLKKSGSIRVCEVGEGDDSKNIQQDFDKWKALYWENLYSYFSKNKEKYDKKRQEVENCFENTVPEYETLMLDSSELGKIKKEHEVKTEDYEYFLKRYYNSSFIKIDSIQELRKSNKNGSTLRVVYDLSSSSDITYKVADNIGIYPTNTEASVITLAQKLKFDLNKVIVVKKLFPEVKKKISLPNEMTIKDILLHVVDLSGPVSKDLIEKFLKYCYNENQYNDMNILLVREGQLREFLSKNYNIVDFINRFDSINIPFLEFYSIMPKIAPRYYTVASSQNLNKNRLEIVISLVVYDSCGNRRLGHTSNYFKQIYDSKLYLSSNVRTKITIRESSFRLPDNNRPVLMFSTGTGVAPFISFLQETEYRKNLQKDTNELILFFGSKNRDCDFIYEEEILSWKENGLLSGLYLAFSRDSAEKYYIQNKLKEESKLVLEMILRKYCLIYVCGGVSMGNEVIKVIKELLEGSEGEIGKEEVKLVESRIITELWG